MFYIEFNFLFNHVWFKKWKLRHKIKRQRHLWIMNLGRIMIIYMIRFCRGKFWKTLDVISCENLFEILDYKKWFFNRIFLFLHGESLKYLCLVYISFANISLLKFKLWTRQNSDSFSECYHIFIRLMFLRTLITVKIKDY